MSPKVKQFFNRSILVSIPALFEDGECRAHALRSIEAERLWLTSDELTERLLADRERNAAETTPVIFVPAAQIAAVLPPAAPSAQPTEATATPAETGAVATGAGAPKPTKDAPAEAAPKRAGAATPTK
jgi:hypothetical protein